MLENLNFRCTGPAWLFAWATAVFLPSAVIAGLGLSAPVRASGAGFLAATWKVADDVGPAAKLMLGALLLISLLGAAPGLKEKRGAALIVNTLLGVLAMLAVLLFLPAAYSRGFGIGLTGTRLDPALLPIYLAGAALAGAVFTLSCWRCDGRLAGTADVRQG